MKSFIAVLAFALLASVCGSPLFHSHSSHGRSHRYYPVAVREVVKVPEVHVQKVVHQVPVYVPVVRPVVHHVPVVQHVVPAPAPVTTERPVDVEVGGGVVVAANPGAVHVVKTKPAKVSV
ncbi:uncharacterized protein LOC133394072 [Anopheles gambiae]|uniref:uncharacterized protein LOC133394072 n=1 Tax=Anopheles gambiae TaxID=7165 RepID=UPI002AC8D09D|nr:uncharacterized protein LOC133394072 [Anopheles gambiae]